MFKRKLSILLIVVFILGSILFIMPSSAATVRHVGPGQTYNGTTEVAINQAINAATSGDTIYIHQATYTINHPVSLKSGLIIKGDGIDNTIIYGPSDACNSESEQGYFYGYDVSNIEIYGLTFDSASSGPSDNGHGDYRICIRLRYSDHVTVHDCSSKKWIYNDFLKCSASDYITMYNCNLVPGHAGGYFYQCTNVKAYNNRIVVYTKNAGLRGDGTTNSEYYNNTIWCEASSGQAAFEYQNACGGTNMHHNLVYDLSLSYSGHYVTQNAGGVTGTVTFSNNVYWNCSGGVQVGTGTGNIVNPTNHDVAYWEGQGYGCGSSTPTPTPSPTPTPTPGTWYSGTNFSSQQNLGTGNTGTAVTIEFDVTPLYSNTSGVIGYADSSTTVDAFSDMAMILSMDADHYFYARNGSSYAKSANVSFSANTSYHIKILGNMTAKTYDVFITPSGGSQTQIANDYAFRTDAPATDDAGKVCLNSATTNSNDFKVQNHTVNTGTVTWYSGTNFSSQQNLGTGNTGTAVTIEFDLTPLYSNTSGIIGYADSSTTIDAFSDMAMILCMEADHYFYARNGGSYAKSANVSFSANTSYHVKIVGNMTAKTYDVFITPSGGSQIQIANDYAFRTGAPTTDDAGKVCLNSATTNSNDFKVQNHTVTH